jgi:hypothetical protein
MNGTDQGLTIGGPRNQFRNVAAGTMAMWARIESPFAVTDRILMKFSTGTGANTTRVSIGIAAGIVGIQIGCRILDGDTLASHQSNFGTPPGIGEWHHYLVTFDFTLKRFYIYYDGALFNATQMTATTAGNTSDTASLAAYIGYENTASPNRFWPGSMDDVVCFNRLVGANDAQTIYASRGRAFLLNGLTGYWQCAEGGEGVAVVQAADVSGLNGGASPLASPTYTGGITLKRRSRKHLGAFG